MKFIDDIDYDLVEKFLNSPEGLGMNLPWYVRKAARGHIVVLRYYDKNYIKIQFISFIVMSIILFAAFIFTYSFPYFDPISQTKEIFLKAQITTSLISAIGVFLITILTKSTKKKLITRLIILGTLTLIVMIILMGFKLYMNNKYNNESNFSNFYEQFEPKDENEKIKLSINEFKFISAKENYINKSMNAYTVFSIKTTLCFMVLIFIIVGTYYFANRLSNFESKKERLAKDDLILYDKEENIKF